MADLINYLPNVLKEVREFKSTMFAEQPEFLSLFQEVQTTFNNMFVLTATEYGIKRWESILGIVPNMGAETLEFRRVRILTRLQTFLPFTERALKQKLDEVFSANNVDFSIDYNNYRVNTTIEQADMNFVNEVINLFKKMVPANMEWAFKVIVVLLEHMLYVGVDLRSTVVTRTVFDMG